MTGWGIAVSFLLLGWGSLLYVPFRWRPVASVMEKPRHRPAAASR